MQLNTPSLCVHSHRHSSLQPAGQHPGDDHDHQNNARRSGRSEAARVAYSMAWFGFGQLSGGQQQLAHHQQQLQQMSLHDWRQLQQQELPPVPARPKRWRTPQRRGWVDRVASRARRDSSSSSSRQAYHLPAADHLWRTRHEGGGWDAPGRHVAGVLSAAQQGVQGCVEAVQTTGRAGAGSVQRMTTMLVTPVQAVVQQMVGVFAPFLIAGNQQTTHGLCLTSMSMQRPKNCTQHSRTKLWVMGMHSRASLHKSSPSRIRLHHGPALLFPIIPGTLTATLWAACSRSVHPDKKSHCAVAPCPVLCVCSALPQLASWLLQLCCWRAPWQAACLADNARPACWHSNSS